MTFALCFAHVGCRSLLQGFLLLSRDNSSEQTLRRLWTSLVAGQIMTQAFGCLINTKINPQLALNLLAWEDYCAGHPRCEDV